VEAVVQLYAPSLTAASLSGRLASARPAPTVAAPDTDCAPVLSPAAGAAGAAPCAAPVGSAGGPQGAGAHSASAVGAVRDCPASPDPRSPRDFPVSPLRAVDTSMRAEPAILAPRTRTFPDPVGEAAPRPRRASAPVPTTAPRRASAEEQLAAMSAGRAAPTPTDGGGSSAATPSRRSLRSASLRALRVTAPRPGGRAPEARWSQGERGAPGAIPGQVHAPLGGAAADLAPRTRSDLAAAIARHQERERLLTITNLRSAPQASAGTTVRDVPAVHATKPRRLGKPAQGGN
jgi:hypothetical protein